MDKTDQKYLVTPDADEKETLEKTKKERFQQLAKAILKKDIVQINTITKAASPNNMTTDADGGYLVPDETAAEIMQLIPTFGQARQLVDVGVFPRNRDIYKIPKDATTINVYYPGENGAITLSKAAVTDIEMIAKKAVAGVALTNELKEYAIVDFVNYLKNKAAEAFAKDEDSKVFGTSNSVFTGLFYATQTFGKEVTANVSSLTYEELLAMIYGIDSNYLQNAVWVGHRTLLQTLRGIKDTTGQPILVEANAAGLPTLFGLPFKMVEAAPPATVSGSGQPYLLLGNLKNSFLKSKSDVVIDLSTEATMSGTSAFENDLTFIRFKKTWSFHPGLIQSYAVAQTA
jgi:HK97 family phage major capsid protein